MTLVIVQLCAFKDVLMDVAQAQMCALVTVDGQEVVVRHQ